LSIRLIVPFVQIGARPFEKTSTTLPRRQLGQIDEYAQTHGENRSGFHSEAACAAARRKCVPGASRLSGNARCQRQNDTGNVTPLAAALLRNRPIPGKSAAG
jgi:hypothetical protein